MSENTKRTIIGVIIAGMFLLAGMCLWDYKVETRGCEASDIRLLLSKDSCGVKVYKLTYEGVDYLVNNQGGIVRAEK